MIHRRQDIKDGNGYIVDQCFIDCKIKSGGTFQDCVFIDCTFVVVGVALDCVFIRCKGTQNLGRIQDDSTRWTVTWSLDYITIGCERHTVSDWTNMSDEDISSMSPYALRWWRKHKAWVLEKHKEYYDI